MVIDVKLLSQQLLNQTRSEYLRALDLFELQVGCFRENTASSRRLAAIKLMEHIETEEGFVPAKDMSKALKIANYRGLLIEAMGDKGWKSIRSTPKDKNYDEFMARKIEAADINCRIIDFMLRFKPAGKVKKASFNVAQTVVRKASLGVDYKRGMGRTNIVEQWGYLKNRNVMTYTILKYFPQLKPFRLKTKKFSNKLLEHASDTALLLDLFGTYNSVLSKIEFNGVKKLGAVIDLPKGSFGKTVQQKPLDSHTMQALGAYQSTDSGK